VIKHANPTQVSVTLRCHSNGVDLDVCDDGCGFDPASVSSEHLGLGIMNERAAAIHAALSLQSKPGCGTRIQVNWSEPEPEESV
jgi:signal transduction histidine kinase